MKEGPDISLIGALIGDPARANMLTALMSGKALTASELASEAGITLQTASAHLAKLDAARLISPRKQGRHKYFTLADDEVGALLENIMALAAKRGLTRTRTGPKDPALRKARICYNHLAGELGVALYDGLRANGWITGEPADLQLSPRGAERFTQMGLDFAAIERPRRPLCKSCLDWSARRSHLAGSLGTAILTHITDIGWARRLPDTRIIHFTPNGEAAFRATFEQGR
ncbi:winged helix-turn-helix domain-containing protein [Roseobacter sp. N2S]|uniref:ArsR/SmtB family transcription factor n=1 Tax=Roseobacter sp. N2S TaxID=2663844 RepID=UPI0028565F7D|nr:winged helix-turn-helix domain-containing protein [Roseobacter sp. N2S]MDR6264792.1 DNA-binding transcriptional ArsR family regulator [Roseobacter sp. N2S]